MRTWQEYKKDFAAEFEELMGVVEQPPVERLQELVCEAVEKYDYEFSTEKDAGEQIERSLMTVGGCYEIIEMLLGFIGQLEEELWER